MAASTTTTTTDFESFERLNNEFSALIDSMIPRDFGASSGKNASSSTIETADEIIDRNRALRKGERHRKIISGGTAGPESVTSNAVSASTLPLANALKRRHGAEPSASTSGTISAGNASQQNVPAGYDDDDDEEESRTRVVTKKSKLSRDAFATKKQTGKVKAKPVAPLPMNGKVKQTAEGGGTSGKAMKLSNDLNTSETAPSTSKSEFNPESRFELPSTPTHHNPFKLSYTQTPSTPFSMLQPGINNIFSTIPSETPRIPTTPTSKTANQNPSTPLTPANDPARERTGMTPPPDLHGKERKRWRKKMKKMQAKKDGVDKGGDGDGDENEGDED
ncbi:hypothetical protein HD553DRAFT_345033 [Filobasidium floriforme]|uniref:uncharacterized protein n=1 Tax=Filobasidium floriforme TaxID=5210 RepID=UPI001E8E32F4|nr:uncharacterized protein HD553DRAFT_345033 [Filobasidium floriforme]KAH8080123.1 hypothetical protein HD553DRAFT_345033 [Filobasidium floriforme]